MSQASSRVSRVLDRATFLLLMATTGLIPLLFWPWSDDVFVGPKFDAIRLLTAAGAASSGAWLLAARPPLRIRLPDAAAAAFLVANVAAYAFSISHRVSLLGEPLQQGGLVSVFAFAAGYTIARVSVRNLDRLGALMTVAALAGTVAAAYGLVQLAGIDPVWAALPNGRVFSSIGQPNWLAAYLVMTIPLTASSATAAGRGSVRLLGFAAVTIQVVVLAATLSRSAYLGLLVLTVVGAIMVGRQYREKRQLPTRLLAGAAAAVVIGAVLLGTLGRITPAIAPEDMARRAASVLDIRAFDSQRYLGLWQVGASIVIDHPLTGTGQDTYAILFPAYRDSVLDEPIAEHFSRFRPESPHNVYLSVASGAGLPALAAYLLLIGAVLAGLLRQAGGRSRRSILAIGIFLALVGHLVTDSFMTADLSGSWLAWALMGSAVASMAAKPGVEPGDRDESPSASSRAE